MADHVFDPVHDGFNNGIRLFLADRGCEVTNQHGITNIQRYLARLNTAPTVTRPVGDIYIGSHANDRGYLAIDLDDDSPAQGDALHTTVGELIDAVASGSVVIAAGTAAVDSQFRIRGCKIGQDEEFLRLFKLALGSGIAVNAPVFYDIVWTLSGEGVYEYFGYDLEIAQPTAFADPAAVTVAQKRLGARTAALAAYDAAGLSYIGATAVPTADWNGLLAPATWPGWLLASGSKKWEGPAVSTPLGQTVGKGRTTVRTRNEFRHTVDKMVVTVNGAAGQTSLPFLVSSLSSFPGFQPQSATNLYPLHMRYDAATVQDFVDLFVWVPVVKGTATAFTGTRHVYSAAPVVVDPLTGVLRFNFEPAKNSGLASVTTVPESDPDPRVPARRSSSS